MPYINQNNYSLFYEKAGSGPKAMVLFHGFGQDRTVFNQLCVALSETHTCYCFDLPFHGNSKWQLTDSDVPLSKELFTGLMETFLSENSISTFAVLGFSIGSRLAMATAELLPKRVTELILLAPDGIKPNTWYQFATGSGPGRKTFRYVISNATGWIQVLSIARSLRIVPPALLRFAESQMNSKEKRWKVYHTWMLFRDFKFDLSGFSNTIKKNQIVLRVFVGEHDTVIPPSSVEKLRKYLPEFSPVLLACKHQRVISSSIDYLKVIKK